MTKNTVVFVFCATLVLSLAFGFGQYFVQTASLNITQSSSHACDASCPPPPPPPSLPSAPYLYFSPRSGSFSVGQTLTIYVRANSGTYKINAVTADFAYNPSLLKLTKVNTTNSAFTAKFWECWYGNLSNACPPRVTPTAGRVYLTQGLFITSVSGTSLPIATLTFRTLAAGKASAAFMSNAQMAFIPSPGPYTSLVPASYTIGSVTTSPTSLLSTNTSQQISLSTTATQTSPLLDTRADLNGDGRVNVLDQGLLNAKWGSTARPKADINQDGIVNIVDQGLLLNAWTN